MNETNSQLHALVDGHVQGVGFRYFVRDCAEILHLSGWVRNTRTGFVEVTAEGPRSDLEKLLTAIQRGPTGSFVTQVQTQWLPAAGQFQTFEVSHTVDGE